MAGEKIALEEPVATLDGAVESFSKQIEALLEDNKALENRVEIGRSQLEVKEIRRMAVEEDVAWPL